MPTPRLIVHITLDDLGLDQHGKYGMSTTSPGIPTTPWLDDLWDNGVRFTKHFAEPFCSPYRACHFTGRHTEDTGIGDIIENDSDGPLLLKELLIPEVLKIWFGDRIQTAAIGKWHLGNAQVGGKRSPLTAGFDYFFGSERNIIDFYEDDLSCQGQTYPAYGRFVPELLASAAITWIRRFAAQRTKLGYLYLPFHLPHNPFWKPPESLYDEARWVCPTPQPASQTTSAATPYFKAYVESMDTLAQRIIDSIPAWLLDETVVFVSSDNGTEAAMLALESYPAGLGGGAYNANHAKRSVFDPGIRTPAYAWSPNTDFVASPGRTVTGLIQSVDWYATTLAMFGVPWQEIVAARGPRSGVSAAVRSKSFLTSLNTNTATTNREYAYVGIFEPNGYNRGTTPGRRAITDGTWKLIFPSGQTAFGTSLLYNIVNDPREQAPEPEPFSGSPDRERLQAAWDAFYADMPPVTT